MRSLGSRIAGTILVGVGWLVFMLVWLAFYAGNYGFWQNIAILLASVVVAIGITAVTWIEWIIG
jgi:hypothetical protein